LAGVVMKLGSFSLAPARSGVWALVGSGSAVDP
jgi:hypothetical protein